MGQCEGEHRTTQGSVHYCIRDDHHPMSHLCEFGHTWQGLDDHVTTDARRPSGLDEAAIAEVRERLVLGFRQRLRLAGNPAEPTKWWADDLADFAVKEFSAAIAARLTTDRNTETHDA